ncbi:MAG: phosphatase PAP2 family protein, partial [Anaerococcus sp.]|nr:phosphatase PAP2 family protein [Anaerococcus sp.]
LYLYVHFPSDVFCGIIIGVLTSIFTLKFYFSKTGFKFRENLEKLSFDFKDLRKM